MAAKILISAGEASGDRYASRLVELLRARRPDLEFFGCAGVAMRAAGVRAVVDAESLSVVGLVEVVRHLPRIHGEYRKLLAAAARERPVAAVLTDSSGFHLRVAPKLKALGVEVFYLVAPQAWAWREGRVRVLRRNVKELHCIFPFEEEWFQSRGVPAFYIGHPLAGMVQPRWSRQEFFERCGLPAGQPLLTLCPGSRRGEVFRHLPVLAGALEKIRAQMKVTVVLALPGGASWTGESAVAAFVRQTGSVPVEGETWDAMAHADLTMPASGTVTVEAALLGAPMVTYYRVSPLTYWIGRPLVKTPYFSMVNLVARKRVVEELIQHRCTGDELAGAALALLGDENAKTRMRAELSEVATLLRTDQDPLDQSAARIAASLRLRGVT
ncbi:MAG: lipid-A-disaccharide synthase [Bryobacteraceae bacterium]|nr:lipid-A-disaccharide synthase [Bryobacteraceae bacterium]